MNRFYRLATSAAIATLLGLASGCLVDTGRGPGYRHDHDVYRGEDQRRDRDRDERRCEGRAHDDERCRDRDHDRDR
jgi:hypothetical protein